MEKNLLKFVCQNLLQSRGGFTIQGICCGIQFACCTGRFFSGLSTGFNYYHLCKCCARSVLPLRISKHSLTMPQFDVFRLLYLAYVHVCVCACMRICMCMCACMCMEVVENATLLLFCVVIVSSVAFRERKPFGWLATSRSCSIVVYGLVRTRLCGWVGNSYVWLLWTCCVWLSKDPYFRIPSPLPAGLVWNWFSLCSRSACALVPSLRFSLCP